MTVFSQVVTVASGILTISALASLLIKPVRERIRNWMLGWDSIVNSQRCQLRADMLRTYYKHKDERRIRQYELENFLLEYQAYKALGGNSFIDRIYKEVVTWEVET